MSQLSEADRFIRARCEAQQSYCEHPKCDACVLGNRLHAFHAGNSAAQAVAAHAREPAVAKEIAERISVIQVGGEGSIGYPQLLPSRLSRELIQEIADVAARAALAAIGPGRSDRDDIQTARLPFDVQIGATRFRAGVHLSTLISAARRWYELYAATQPPIDEDAARDLRDMMGLKSAPEKPPAQALSERARGVDEALVPQDIHASRSASQSCARVDATMEGPALRGWNRSELDRLWRARIASLAAAPTLPELLKPCTCHRVALRICPSPTGPGPGTFCVAKNYASDAAPPRATVSPKL